MKTNSIVAISFLGLLPSAPTAGVAQSVYQVSRNYDSADAPAAYPFPGFSAGFRQQILISASRLRGLVGRDIRGIWVRRDLGDTDALVGGSVDVEIRISRATVAPAGAQPTFASNAPQPQAAHFTGRITVPNSPTIGATVTPWSSANSVNITLTTPFQYQGGDLCIDVFARPVPGSEPQFWYVDHESGSYNGGSTPIGRSCSTFADDLGHTLYARDHWLQVGSTMRLTALGMPGSSPLLLFGAAAIPGGIDLSAIGATGCRQLISYFQIIRLAYARPPFAGAPAPVRFEIQIPANTNLLGVSVFTQFADDELALPATQRTNPAGLTTSNGLELRISSLGPDLGMSIVTSNVVDKTSPMPTVGRVDVNRAPVLRLMH